AVGGIEELSDELCRQGETVDRLQKAVRQLGERFQALEDTATPRADVTKPPHY
ncbi:MAG: SlyX family protein, partial [Rhizobiaceae bacterium]|nr:SlyX family protein [Rhizobiaceae bacterium]